LKEAEGLGKGRTAVREPLFAGEEKKGSSPPPEARRRKKRGPRAAETGKGRDWTL